MSKSHVYPGQGDHPVECPVFRACIANRITEPDYQTLHAALRVLHVDSAAVKLAASIGALVKKYRTPND
jgi:hypothetical protein